MTPSGHRHRDKPFLGSRPKTGVLRNDSNFSCQGQSGSVTTTSHTLVFPCRTAPTQNNTAIPTCLTPAFSACRWLRRTLQDNKSGLMTNNLNLIKRTSYF